MAERSGFGFGVVLAQRHDADEGDESSIDDETLEWHTQLHSALVIQQWWRTKMKMKE
mgnify:CR=1 FL=1